MELVADASSLINIIASGHAEALVRLWNVVLVLTEKVDEEVIRNREVLERLYALRLARREPLPPGALEIFIMTAAQVDDGEASAIALAHYRRWALLTDDGRAQTVWKQMNHASVEPARDTCHMLQQIETCLERATLREIMAAIESKARFRPPRAHADWWARVGTSAQ